MSKLTDQPRRPILYDLHRSIGAKFTVFGGWEMPLRYPGGTIDEHMSCRNACAIFDTSHLGSLLVEGGGAFDMLQKELTNDLGKISPGRAQYTHLVTPSDGSVQDDLIIWWLEPDRFMVLANAANTQLVADTLHAEDITSSRALLAVQGPNTRKVLSMIYPELSTIKSNQVRVITIDGASCTAAGTGYTGEDGIEIEVPAAHADSLFSRILDAGATPAGLGARDTLRLEAGLPLFGHELGPGISPLQAGLDWVVGWQKKSFRGKVALEKERESGPGRILWGLIGENRRPLRDNSYLYIPFDEEHGERGGHEGQGEHGKHTQQSGDHDPIGTITSGGYGPTVGRGIAMALISTDVEASPGMIIDAVHDDRTVPVRLSKLPFVPRSRTR